MRFINHLQTATAAALFGAAAFTLQADDGIRVYTVPKEAADASSAGAASDMRAATSDIPVNRAKFTYTTPSTWKELTPDGIRLAYFSVAGQGGQNAEVTVISFPGSVGTELENVNRWRNELQLPPIAQDKLVSENVTVDGNVGKLYEFMGGGKATFVADVPRNGNSWFFKLRGDKDVVTEAEPVFRDFLKSIHFDTNATEIPPASVAASTSIDPRKENQAPAASAVDSGGDTPKWTVPSNWTEKQPGPMVFKTFTAATSGGKTAGVAISFFQGSMGGTLANVNRWRGQMGLAPVEENQLGSVTQSLDTSSGAVTLVDFTGTDSRTGQPGRLVAISQPHGDSIWFYKLTGEPEAVGSEKDQFLKFVQSVRYP